MTVYLWPPVSLRQISFVAWFIWMFPLWLDAGSQSPESNFSQNCTTSNLQRAGEQKRQLSLGDETQERGSPSIRPQSPFTPDVNNCQHNGARKSITVSQQLSILSRLEFRKLFLVLSYIGRLVLLVSLLVQCLGYLWGSSLQN